MPKRLDPTVPRRRRTSAKRHGEPALDAPSPPRESGAASTQQVALRTSSGIIGELPLGAPAQRAAIALSYVLRNRRRWADHEESRADQSKQAHATLVNVFGMPSDAIAALAHADAVEVGVPFESEKVGWEGRVMAWEYLLSGATRSLRYGRPLMVVRHLRRAPATPRMFVAPERVLFVESAPAGLRAGYTFDSERKLVHEGIGPGAHVHMLKDPTREQLSMAVQEFEPDVIHITGFDNHQGLTLLGSGEDLHRRDGILLRTADGAPDAVEETATAALLTSAARKPLLVSFNLYNSAARLAALVVAGGAGAALGFQDTFDDPLAEFFYARFYREWRGGGWDVHAAFRATLMALRASAEGLQGTGIALWTAFSMFDPVSTPAATRRRRGPKRAAPPRTSMTAEAPPVSVSGDIEVRVDPFAQLNYSLLHNNRELFDVFLLRNFTPEKPREISVKVTLFVGTDSYPCETTFRLVEEVKDLSREIHVPLISTLGRSVRESMRTSLYVEVTCDGRVHYRRTHPVTLLPIDEWRDDDDNRHWLPSFVLPRDPTVPRVVHAAQRYLMALRDDPNAGFDGYQSYNDGTSDDPGEPIDLQVQALWSALLYDMPLSYINPPPTFTDFSQRLRAPSDVTGGRRGTCIDLALLLASCLEYVEIHPVVILLEGHAFPGYWRNEKAHAEFQRVRTPESITRAEPEALREVVEGQTFAWFFDKSCYRELVECVRRNDLVLLETVCLTQRNGFWEAVEEGEKNLRNRSEFHSMIDIKLARESNVTPLPVIPTHVSAE